MRSSWEPHSSARPSATTTIGPEERGGAGGNRAVFAGVLALLLSTGWVANHFVALMPSISDRQHPSAARLDAIFGIYALGLLPGLLFGGRASDALGRQSVALVDLFRATAVGAHLPADAVVSTELELKYAGYFERERAQADRLRRMGDFSLDDALPYEQMRSLSFEASDRPI